MIQAHRRKEREESKPRQRIGLAALALLFGCQTGSKQKAPEKSLFEPEDVGFYGLEDDPQEHGKVSPPVPATSPRQEAPANQITDKPPPLVPPESNGKRSESPPPKKEETSQREGTALEMKRPVKIAKTKEQLSSSAPAPATKAPSPPRPDAKPAQKDETPVAVPQKNEKKKKPLMEPKKGSVDEEDCLPSAPAPKMVRKEVYRGMPFQPGEVAKFKVSYLGVHAGYGFLKVEDPVRHGKVWHRVISGEANTGDWYKYIFVLRDKIRTLSRPWDFGASQFYVEQDEGKLWGRRYVRKKWIKYDHDDCKSYELVRRKDKPERRKVVFFKPGSNDVLSATYYLRTLDYEIGKKIQVPVYTSEKNWMLEALPVKKEKIQVPAGTHRTVKLKLQTYLGEELQQRGDLFVWIAIDHPNRPMVRIDAKVKIGTIRIALEQFTAGLAH